MKAPYALSFVTCSIESQLKMHTLYVVYTKSVGRKDMQMNHICVYIYICISIRIHVYMCKYIRVHVDMQVYTCVCL